MSHSDKPLSGPVIGSMDAPYRLHPHRTPDIPQVDIVCSDVSIQPENIPQRSGTDSTATSDHPFVNQSRLIKKKVLAAQLSISPRTVDDLVAKRAIPYIAISPRLHLFDLEAVKAALSKRFEVRAKGVFV